MAVTIGFILVLTFLLIWLGVGAGTAIAIISNAKLIAIIIGLIVGGFIIKKILK